MQLSELKNLECEYNNMKIDNEDQVASYYKIRQQLDHLARDVQGFITKPQYVLPFLQPGRLVHVSAARDASPQLAQLFHTELYSELDICHLIEQKA